MQPAWRRYSFVRPGVRVPDPAPRTAGIVAPTALSQAPALPPTADYASSRWGDAYWLAREDDAGPGTLYVSSGARLIVDLRGELGMSPLPAVWTTEVFTRLRERAIAASPLISPSGWVMPQPGAQVTPDWLMIALWYTYERGVGLNPRVIVLPTWRTMPRAGADLGAPGQRTGAADAFDPEELGTRNPFGTGAPNPARPPAPETPPPATQPASSDDGGGLGWLLALGAAAAALSD